MVSVARGGPGQAGDGADEPGVVREQQVTADQASADKMRDSPGITPRLRFDKVALRLVHGVCDALQGAVPDGLCVVFTVTAPIQEPAKTMAALVETIRAQLSLGAESAEHVEVLQGNKVRVRVVTSRSPNAKRAAGFVHNPDPPPTILLDMAQSLLERGYAPIAAGNASNAPDLDMLRPMRPVTRRR